MAAEQGIFSTLEVRYECTLKLANATLRRYNSSMNAVYDLRLERSLVDGEVRDAFVWVQDAIYRLDDESVDALMAANDPRLSVGAKVRIAELAELRPAFGVLASRLLGLVSAQSTVTGRDVRCSLKHVAPHYRTDGIPAVTLSLHALDQGIQEDVFAQVSWSNWEMRDGTEPDEFMDPARGLGRLFAQSEDLSEAERLVREWWHHQCLASHFGTPDLRLKFKRRSGRV